MALSTPATTLPGGSRLVARLDTARGARVMVPPLAVAVNLMETLRYQSRRVSCWACLPYLRFSNLEGTLSEHTSVSFQVAHLHLECIATLCRAVRERLV